MSDAPSAPLTYGAHHVGLTVPNLAAARDFFCQALGFAEVGGQPDYPALFVSDGRILLTLWRVADPAAALPFDRKRNVGLHHLALAVADDAALDAAYERVRRHPGVTVEFPPAPLRPGSATRHLMLAIPGGIRVELATPL